MKITQFTCIPIVHLLSNHVIVYLLVVCCKQMHSEIVESCCGSSKVSRCAAIRSTSICDDRWKDKVNIGANCVTDTSS